MSRMDYPATAGVPAVLGIVPEPDGCAFDGFTSAIPFDAERIGAAAVYCSDGRFGDQMDEFLHLGLGFPRYDRVAIPGGAACLASRARSMWEEGALDRQLRLLVQVHDLHRVVLIAHQDCAFYKHLRVRPESIEARQLEDLVKAAGRVRAFAADVADVAVDAYFARKVEGLVRFEPVAV